MSKKAPCNCLNETQVETIITNVSKLMRLKGVPKKLFSGELKLSQNDIKEFNLSSYSPKNLAEKYALYEVPDEFYFVIVYAHEFKTSYFQACEWFNHLFKPFVRGTIERPLVYLGYAFEMNQNDFDKLPIKLLDCPYRLVSLPQLHHVVGSPNGLEGFVKDYELLKGEKAISFNNKRYPLITNEDVAVKLVNALPGEIIRAKQLYNDKGSVYAEYKIREVVRSKTTLGQFDSSGIDNFDV